MNTNGDALQKLCSYGSLDMLKTNFDHILLAYCVYTINATEMHEMVI